MTEILLHTLEQTVEVTGLVFIMMIAVEFVDIKTEGKLHRFLKKGSWREYSIASLLGVTPGCSGSFL
ncbi:MAG: hypothetical protein D6732_20325, partial [Methanobacteriota archaeon]